MLGFWFGVGVVFGFVSEVELEGKRFFFGKARWRSLILSSWILARAVLVGMIEVGKLGLLVIFPV